MLTNSFTAGLNVIFIIIIILRCQVNKVVNIVLCRQFM